VLKKTSPALCRVLLWKAELASSRRVGFVFD
jgi:hypothetical protein